MNVELNVDMNDRHHGPNILYVISKIISDQSILSRTVQPFIISCLHPTQLSSSVETG